VLRTTKIVKVKREVEFKKQISSKDIVAVTEKPPPNGNIDVCSVNSTIDHAAPQRTQSAETDGSTSFVSYPAGSIAVIQKRLEGAPKTRRRATSIPTTDEHIYDNNDTPAVGKDIVQPPNGIDEKILLKNTRNDDAEQEDKYETKKKEVYACPPSKQMMKPTFPSDNDQHNHNTIDRISNIGRGTTGPVRMITRRASTGAISRFGSLTDLRIDENHPNNDESHLLLYNDRNNDNNDDDGAHYEYNNNYHSTRKLMNADLPEIPKYRKRLGIRRSMDLSGESIEFYPRRTSMGNLSNCSGIEPTDGNEIDPTALVDDDDNDDDDDESDYIKASAIIEALLRMADVGHYYQNWYNMTTWSARMFHERIRGEPDTAKRDEIYMNWFNNQILIMDSYLKPLAVQLDETGVFGEYHGGMLVQNVEEIRRHWMIYGYDWSQKLMDDIGTSRTGQQS
jgi:hypothetical protein